MALKNAKLAGMRGHEARSECAALTWFGEAVNGLLPQRAADVAVDALVEVAFEPQEILQNVQTPHHLRENEDLLGGRDRGRERGEVRCSSKLWKEE